MGPGKEVTMPGLCRGLVNVGIGAHVPRMSGHRVFITLQGGAGVVITRGLLISPQRLLRVCAVRVRVCPGLTAGFEAALEIIAGSGARVLIVRGYRKHLSLVRVNIVGVSVSSQHSGVLLGLLSCLTNTFDGDKKRDKGNIFICDNTGGHPGPGPDTGADQGLQTPNTRARRVVHEVIV